MQLASLAVENTDRFHSRIPLSNQHPLPQCLLRFERPGFRGRHRVAFGAHAASDGDFASADRRRKPSSIGGSGLQHEQAQTLLPAVASGRHGSRQHGAFLRDADGRRRMPLIEAKSLHGEDTVSGPATSTNFSSCCGRSSTCVVTLPRSR